MPLDERVLFAIRDAVTWFGLRLLVALHDAVGVYLKRRRKLRGSLAKLRRRWLWRRGRASDGFRRHGGSAPHNRTPAHLEEAVARLHVEQPQLGTGQLQRLAERVLGLRAHRETIRRILRRNRALIAELEDAQRERPRRIQVDGPRRLWGIDHTLVWVLGFFPVWLLGIVDYRGSRLISLERCAPTTSAVTAALAEASAREGKPERLLTDNHPCFTSAEFTEFVARQGIQHTRIRPAHPWTNGRIERLFRTFKETVFAHLWLFASVTHVDRMCADFVQFYNHDRPHSAYGGRTPDEVFFERAAPRRPLGRVEYFDGELHWYRLG